MYSTHLLMIHLDLSLVVFLVRSEPIFQIRVTVRAVLLHSYTIYYTLVRYALMATHTHEQVDRSVVALKKIFVEQGIIK